MASEGPNLPTTLSDNATLGTVAWVGAANAATSNDSYASATCGSGAISHYLLGVKYNFSSVTGTVDGILAEVEENGLGVSDSTVKLKSGASFVGANKAVGTPLDVADTFAAYGGAADTWTAGLTPSDVTDASFGFGYSIVGVGAGGVGNVDSVRITITYTPAGITQIERFENPVHHILTRRQDVVAYKWVGRRWFEEKIEFLGWTVRGPQFRETRYATQFHSVEIPTWHDVIPSRRPTPTRRQQRRLASPARLPCGQRSTIC